MSAFVQDKAHIDALVALAVRGPSGVAVEPGRMWHGPRWESFDAFGKSDWINVEHKTADTLGYMLWAENVRSVQYRYPSDEVSDLPGPADLSLADVVGYVWPMQTRRLTAVQGLMALDGYEYQSCEHPEWRDSEAYRFCDALRRSLIGYLPGYHEAGSWSIHV